MNAFLKRSNQARALLQHEAEMDDLNYQLMVFEAGCNALDELVRPVLAINKGVAEAYRQNLTELGWWFWFELEWRKAEIRLHSEFTDHQSLVSLQTAAWKRSRLMDEARGLRHTKAYSDSYETWLKLLDDTLPKVQPQQSQPQTAHAKH